MRLLGVLICLIASDVLAGEVYGHFSVDRYTISNLPEYTDTKGEPLIYGIDLEVHKPFFNRHLTIMGGIVGKGAKHGFTQGGGKVQATISVMQVDFYFYHLSLHNLDYRSTSRQRFLNDNHVGIKFKFGDHR